MDDKRDELGGIRYVEHEGRDAQHHIARRRRSVLNMEALAVWPHSSESSERTASTICMVSESVNLVLRVIFRCVGLSEISMRLAIAA